MSFARDVYTATEEQTDFTITFPYIDQEHVEVSQAGTTLTEDTDFTIVSGTTVRLTAEATAGDTVVIVRKTSQSTRLVDYATASTLTEEDLDNDSLQAFYLAQEAIDAVALGLGVDVNDLWDAVGKRITEVGEPTADADAATKAYVDEVLVEAGNAPASSEATDGMVLVTTTEGDVEWAELAEAYIPDGLIDAGMLAALTITEAEMANESVTGTQLEDASVNEEHFVTGGFPLTAFDATAGTEGQVLKNEEGTSVAWGAGGGAGLKSMQVFSTPGAFEWARPAGVTMIEVTLVGAGGGGGDSNGGAEVSSVGGGGGGGGTVISVVDVTNIATADLVVAAETGGGTNDGADTTWTDGTNTFTAEGGEGGASAAENAAGNGGIGGVPTGTGTCALLSGQPGGPGKIITAGTSVIAGSGGSSSHGYAPHGTYTVGNGDGVDADATAWGAGGAGSPNGGANTTDEGGTGGSGLIIVREFGT